VRPRALGCIVAAFIAFSAAAARADGPKEREAEALFREARELSTSGRFGEACLKFARSQELDPQLGTLFYLADCYEHIGKLASALPRYIEVARLAREAGQKQRADFADERARVLQDRVPHLVLRAAPGVRALAGLRVSIDGAAAPQALDVPVPVDLGAHTIEVAADGRGSFRATRSVDREGETVTVQVESLGADDGSVSAPSAGAGATPAIAPVASPPAPRSVSRTAGFVMIGFGAAGVVASGIAGAVALQKNDASNADGHCDARSRCDATGTELRRSAITAAHVSTAAFVGGAALAGVGVVFIVTAPRPRSTGFAPTVGVVAATSSTLSIGGAF
jgi:hypothetical protein